MQQSRFLLSICLLWGIVLIGCSSDGVDPYEYDTETGQDLDTDKDSDGIRDTDIPGDTASDSDTGTLADTEPDTGYGPWDAPVTDINELPADFPTVNITITAAAMARLDADPYDAADETGSFTDGNNVTYLDVDVNYRGAYQLQNLMEFYGLRNWKLKFPQLTKYENRREWNFNYEPHFRQKMALDLLKFAGVSVPSKSKHVLLNVNGQLQGMYLSYEDPDNKDWLWEQFGHDDGDLFKAAYDIPGIATSAKCFADFTVLGTTDADYMCHYNKKTNHKIAPNDYSYIREFVAGLNNTSDAEIEAWFDANLDVDSFISYLVVANFISNWDSYPQRPKNFWVYENMRAGNMAFIPWDLDATFHSSTNQYNQMGSSASIFYGLDSNDYSPIHVAEGTERPLARRLIAIPRFRQAYIDRYRELSQGILSNTFLNDRLDALNALVSGKISAGDASELSDENDGMTAFFYNRTTAIAAELATLP